MSGRSGAMPRELRIGLITLVVTVGLIALFVIVAPYYSTQTWWELRKAVGWVVPLALVLALQFGLLLFGEQSDSGAAKFGAVVIGLALVVGFVGWLFAHEYQQDKVYARSVQATTDPVPELGQRAPFTIATAQVRPNLGDVAGEVQSTMYVPREGTFSTLVERRGSFSGYQTLLEQRIPLTGRGQAIRCDFASTADARLGGVFNHSLERAVNSERRWVNFAQDDVYGICLDGAPKVVIPLKEQDGWLIVHERPAGVAVYDGRTGTLEFRDDAGGLPGPSYPLSLAAAQREATGAIGGFTEWLFGRVGWELADEADSVNSSNASEFVLTTEGESPRELYVTPQTGRGATTAISAITTVDATLRGPGLAPLVVHKLGAPWLSPGAVTERIRGDFGDVFATQPGAGIHELAPLDGDRWAATIGNTQNVLYRVEGVGDLSDPPCLRTATGTRIRCGPAVNQGGSGPGLAIGPSGSGSPPVPPAPVSADLATLPNEQLVDLIARANDEAARRLAGS